MMEKDPHPFEHNQDTQHTHVNTDDNLVVPVTEEELTATKRPVTRGAVRIETHIIEEPRTLEVTVTEEAVNVSRRAVDREADPAAGFEEETIRVPIRGHEIDVEKRTHVVEEIDVRKRAVRHTEQVTDGVRREEVVIDGEDERERRDEADGPARL